MVAVEGKGEDFWKGLCNTLKNENCSCIPDIKIWLSKKIQNVKWKYCNVETVQKGL